MLSQMPDVPAAFEVDNIIEPKRSPRKLKWTSQKEYKSVWI